MPDVTVMLNWYEESEAELTRVVKDVARLGATKIVAVDGAYENFPGGKARSNHRQGQILRIATGLRDIDLVLYEPSSTWKGDEVAKRQAMLDLALAVTPEDGWLLIFDADWRVLEAPEWIEDYLSWTKADAIEVEFTSEPTGTTGFHLARIFLRAHPSLKMGFNHYTYELPDGTYSEVLVRNSTMYAEQNHEIKIHHLHHARDPERHAKQVAYYEVRDGQKLET